MDGSKRQSDQQNAFLVKQTQVLNNGIELKDDYQVLIQDKFRQPLAQIDANNKNKVNQITSTKTNATANTNVKLGKLKRRILFFFEQETEESLSSFLHQKVLEFAKFF